MKLKKSATGKSLWKQLLAAALISGLSGYSHSLDWAVGVNAGPSEIDFSDVDDAVAAELWGGVELTKFVWLNAGYSRSGDFERADGGPGEFLVQELRLFMEGQRFFNDRFGIFLSAGFSRFDTEVTNVTAVGATQSFTGFTWGANVGLHYELSDNFAARVGYGVIDDVIDADNESVGLSGIHLGVRLELN